jgi:hypothetical protein
LAVQELLGFLLGLVVVQTPKLEAVDYVAVGVYDEHAVVLSDGISKMIMLKIGAAIVAVAIGGSLLAEFAPDFSADLALAVVACFS